MNKRIFKTVVQGTHYQLPVYQVIDGKGIEEIPDKFVDVNFVRGSKLGTEEVTKEEGTLHEHLLSMMISDLQFKSKLVPSRETAIVITKLEEARHWLEEREKSREAAGVLGTYQTTPVTGV